MAFMFMLYNCWPSTARSTGLGLSSTLTESLTAASECGDAAGRRMRPDGGQVYHSSSSSRLAPAVAAATRAPHLLSLDHVCFTHAHVLHCFRPPPLLILPAPYLSRRSLPLPPPSLLPFRAWPVIRGRSSLRWWASCRRSRRCRCRSCRSPTTASAGAHTVIVTTRLSSAPVTIRSFYSRLTLSLYPAPRHPSLARVSVCVSVYICGTCGYTVPRTSW